MFDKRLMTMVPQARRPIIQSVALQWVALVCNIALFLVMGWVLERVLVGAATATTLIGFAALGLVFIAVRFICQAKATEAGARAAHTAKKAVRQTVYDKLVRLGAGYREHTSTATAVQVCVEGAEQLESYFGSYMPQLFYAVLAPLTLFACLAPLSLPSAVVLLACVPLIPVSIVAIQRIAKRAMGRYWNSYTDLGATFLENIQGLTTLKIFSADERAHDAMNEHAESFRRATMRLLRMQLNSITVMDLFAFGGAAVGIVCAIGQYAQGALGFGAAFSIVFLSAEFFLPLRTLGSFFHTAMNGMAAADKMFKLLEAPEPRRGAAVVDPAHADICCSGVGYSYDGERQVLRDVDFAAPRGSFVGIAGESGSGKSTFAGVLSGENRAYTGSIAVGGIDLREVSATSLAQTITYVPFASYLFKGSIADNLRMAAPDAPDAELWKVLEQCRLAAFVRSLGGLDAPVEAAGSNLSGGQRQRLALARALLHDSPIYIFDEATSNVDAESEAAMYAVMHELARTKTVIVISHRLAALRAASTIFVFDGGRIVESGAHDVLLAADGAYARLWHQQEELERYAGVSSVPSDESFDAAPAPQVERRNAAASDKRRARSNWSVMLHLVKLIGPLVPVMLSAVALGVLGFLAAIFLTVFAAWGILGVAGAAGGMAATTACVLLAVCGVVRGPLRYGEQLCNHYLAFKILAVVRDKVFARLRVLAPAKLEGRDRGDLVSLITSDVELLEVFFAHTISPVLIAAVVSLIMTAFIASQSLLLGVVALAAYLVVGVCVPVLASKASGTGGRVVRDGMGALNTFVLDSLYGLRETLQFGRQRTRSAELGTLMDQVAGADLRLKRKAAVAFAATGAIVLAFDIAMLVCASMLVMAGSIGITQAVLASAALMSSFGPVIALANLGSTLQGTLASGARVLDLLDEEPETPDVIDGARPLDFTGLRVRRVGFAYGDERILSDVDFSIEPGSVVQITGKSGSGKSTLLKLMMRFWDVSEGAIELSGEDLRAVSTQSLRSLEAFMTQDTHLFAGTVRDNIALAKPDATDAQIAEAIEKAALTSTIARLPRGLDTQAGELGDALSGGERQRVGLARLFLCDAPFVLLDEPTSNLDSLNEAAVLRALAENKGDRTVVLVSHRPSAAFIADATYSVERGRVS